MYCLVECCRFCLSQNASLIDLTTCDEDNISCYTKISELMPSVFVSNEISQKFPTKICDKCLNKLNDFYKFILTSLKSQNLLLDYTSQLEEASTCKEIIEFREKLRQFFEDAVQPSKPSKTNIFPSTSSNFSIEETSVHIPEVNTGNDSDMEDFATDGKELSKSYEIGDISNDDSSQSSSRDHNLPDFKTWGTACIVCNKTFSCNGNIKKHYIITHMKFRPFKCKNCTKSYTTLDSLRYHNNVTHLNNFKFACHLCDKKFAIPRLLKCHLNSKEHSNIECVICNDKFTSEELLQKHNETYHIYKDSIIGNPVARGAEENVAVVKMEVVEGTSTVVVNNDEQEQQQQSALETTVIDEDTSSEKSKPDSIDRHCNICGKFFNTRSNFKRHYNAVHMNFRPYKCDLCTKGFVTRDSLKYHQRIHNMKNNFHCKLCNKYFVECSDLQLHICITSSLISCDMCNQFFGSVALMEEHKKMNHFSIYVEEKEETIVPDFVSTGEESSSLPIETVHIKKEVEDDCFEVSEPEVSPAFNPVFVKVETVTSDETEDGSSCTEPSNPLNIDPEVPKQFKCDGCDEIFTDIKTFKNHVYNTHTNMETNACYICKKLFHQNPNLFRHMNTYHIQLKKYKCDLCNKNFEYSDTLWQHKQTHISEEDKQCKVCLKTFKTIYYLREHMLIHTKRSRVMCDICNKTFCSAISLKNHKRLHNNEELFQCNVCPYKFKLTELNKHILTHKLGKKYECNLCKKMFCRANALKKHQLTHGEKSFVCDVCPKKFWNKYCLTRHKLTHAQDGEMYTCDKCPNKYTSLNTLNLHKATHVQ